MNCRRNEYGVPGLPQGQQKVLPGTRTITFGFVSSAFITPDPISNVIVTKGSTATYDRDYILKEMNVNGGSGNNLKASILMKENGVFNVKNKHLSSFC